MIVDGFYPHCLHQPIKDQSGVAFEESVGLPFFTYAINDVIARFIAVYHVRNHLDVILQVCINDMLQRDKENRALRKLSRGRMREHYKYLVKRKGPERADVTIEEIEEIRRNTTEKELSDKEHLFRAKTILAACALVLLLLGVLCYKLFL
jgi:hypothetical protein